VRRPAPHGLTLAKTAAALTARRLIERCGGRYVGLALLVDQLEPAVREALAPVAAAALAEDVRG
jgi:hypothetical protein